MSGIRKVANEVWKARLDTAAAVVEAKIVQSIVASRVASFSAQAEASAVQAVQMMETRVQEMAAHSDAHTSRVAEEITQ